MSAPAGWYPDASGTLRWWDGARWTEASAAAPVPAGPPGLPGRVAPGTSANNVWIWLIVLVPIVSGIASAVYLGQLTANMTRLVEVISTPGSTPDSHAVAQWELTSVFTPAYALLLLAGLATYGVSIWFGYRDVRELEARGFVRPFHWAWLFLSPWVYVIGRTAVVSRRGGRGIAPLIVFVVIQLLSLVAGAVWAIDFMSRLMQAVVTQSPTA